MIKSLTGKVWNFSKPDSNEVIQLSNMLGLSSLTSTILVNRGIHNYKDAELFFNPKLKNTIPDPSLFIDMEKGVNRLVKAILQEEKIMIYGDYDVDGITSTALLVTYLRDIGVHPHYSLPDRFVDGYGLNKNAVDIALSVSANLIISVDSGTSSFEAIEYANNNGIDVVIIDHHAQLSETLPNAIAVINPNRIDQNEIENAHIKHMSASGVVFIFLIWLQRILKTTNYLNTHTSQDLLTYSGISALGTLCDVMELKGFNRSIVNYAISNNTFPIGLKVLLKCFGIEKVNNTEDLTFFAGPAINASGRLSSPVIGLSLLLEKDIITAERIAKTLIDLNIQRKEIERAHMSESLCFIDNNKQANDNVLCVYSDNFHEGVIGILAGKLKDKFGKPSFVISFSDGIGKGSARSIQGFDIGHFIGQAMDKNIIISGGGHTLAGGFSIEKSKMQEFFDLANNYATNDLKHYINIDYILHTSNNLSEIYRDISRLEPFGKGNEKPLFCWKELRILSTTKTKTGEHLIITFSDRFFYEKLKATLFNISLKFNIVNTIESNSDQLFDIVGSLSYSQKFGCNIIIEDIRFSIATDQ
ncbi:MAG: single-stranded-DNA-specific exonuclease RecJ [Alphaproteobacteria bacterium]|nr:single-stranded-DNA-specific exonuclease RecJ [Alphaproteobacteria bacterium]